MSAGSSSRSRACSAARRAIAASYAGPIELDRQREAVDRVSDQGAAPESREDVGDLVGRQAEVDRHGAPRRAVAREQRLGELEPLWSSSATRSPAPHARGREHRREARGALVQARVRARLVAEDERRALRVSAPAAADQLGQDQPREYRDRSIPVCTIREITRRSGYGRASAAERRDMMCAVVVRRLKPGAYEAFRQAWQPLSESEWPAG